MTDNQFEVEEKQLEPFLVASIRMTGKYSECGKAFAKIGKKFGRHLCGKGLLVHHDSAYKPENATFDVCMPIRKGQSIDDIEVHELPGGPCISLIHKGPYEQIGEAYQKLTQFADERGLEIVMPSREIYLKGPGMIFKGNPLRYLTEIQMLIAATEASTQD